MLTNTLLEGNFVGAEPHLLSSGTRDSARLLAHVYSDWAKATNTLGSHAGIFALRGVLPYARRSYVYCWSLTMYTYRFLLNGNILASRAFLTSFISHISPSGDPLPIGTTGDEILLTEDALLNFAQLAVRTVQRAAGVQNKIAREAWVRLCGTYQSRGGVLTHPEIRLVCD